MNDPRHIAVILTLVVAAAGCGADTPAGEALDDAEQKVEQAAESIDDMQRDVKSLEAEEQDLRDQLDAAVQKQMELWEQQLELSRERLTRLPAADEQRLEPELDRLQLGIATLKGKLAEYASATADDEPRLRTEVEDRLQSLQSAFDEVEGKMSEAESG